MNIQELIQYIQLNIKANGIKSITGTILQQILVEICENITLSEVSKPLKISDELPTEDGIYLALESGMYSNGINVDLTEGITYLVLNEEAWSKTVYPVNLVPAGVIEEGNTQAVSGGEVYKSLNNILYKENVVFGGIDTVTGAFTPDTTRARVSSIIEKKSNFLTIRINNNSELYFRNKLTYNSSGARLTGENASDLTKEITIDLTGAFSWAVSLRLPDLNAEITQEQIDNTFLTLDYGIEIDFEKVKDSGKLVTQYNDSIINRHYVGLELGAISVSDYITLLSSNQRIRSSDYVDLEIGKEYTITIPEGYKTYRIMGYNNKIPVGAITTNPSNIIPINYSQVKFVFSKTDDTQVITPEELSDFKFTLTKSESDILQNTMQDFLPKFNYINSFVSNYNFWQGKKLTVIGDSISYGFIPRNAPGYPGQLDSYAKLVARELNMEFVNLGISGSTVGWLSSANTTANAPFINRYTNIPLDTDLILIMGGTNDLRKISKLGTIDSTDNTTFYGSYNNLLEGIINRHIYNNDLNIDVRILLITPIQIYPNVNWGTENLTVKDYRDAVIALANKYSLPYFDAWADSGLTPELFRTLQGTEVGYTDMYNPLITDGVHPTQLGNELFKNNIISKIISIGK